MWIWCGWGWGTQTLAPYHLVTLDGREGLEAHRDKGFLVQSTWCSWTSLDSSICLCISWQKGESRAHQGIRMLFLATDFWWGSRLVPSWWAPLLVVSGSPNTTGISVSQRGGMSLPGLPSVTSPGVRECQVCLAFFCRVGTYKISSSSSRVPN